MDPQIKKKIVAEISSTSTKTIEQEGRDSVKRALLQWFLDKTTEVTIKRIESPTIREFKNKGSKILYEANYSILEKMMLSIPLKKT